LLVSFLISCLKALFVQFLSPNCKASVYAIGFVPKRPYKYNEFSNIGCFVISQDFFKLNFFFSLDCPSKLPSYSHASISSGNGQTHYFDGNKLTYKCNDHYGSRSNSIQCTCNTTSANPEWQCVPKDFTTACHQSKSCYLTYCISDYKPLQWSRSTIVSSDFILYSKQRRLVAQNLGSAARTNKNLTKCDVITKSKFPKVA